MKIQQKLAIGYVRAKINMLNIINTRKAAEETFRIFCTPLMIKSRNGKKDVFNDAEPLEFSLEGRKVRGFRCNGIQEHKVLILHGFSSSCHNFYRYVTPLVEKGYEVLAFDAPAHGASDGITTNAIEYTEMIRKVVALYGPVNGFISHSFGGIALCLAMETIPHSNDTRIVLIAPATETTSAIDGAFVMLGIKDSKLRKHFNDIVMEKSGRDASWFSIRRAMNNIKASVLWFHDEEDDITPLEDALKVKEDNHSNIKFVITKGLGHRKIYRDETVISTTAKFL